MKMTVNVECTPLEARQFLGLPNLEPMQAAVMERLEKKMLDEMDRYTPENLMKSWFTALPGTAERMQEMVMNFFRQGARPEQRGDEPRA